MSATFVELDELELVAGWRFAAAAASREPGLDSLHVVVLDLGLGFGGFDWEFRPVLGVGGVATFVATDRYALHLCAAPVIVGGDVEPDQQVSLTVESVTAALKAAPTGKALGTGRATIILDGPDSRVRWSSGAASPLDIQPMLPPDYQRMLGRLGESACAVAGFDAGRLVAVAKAFADAHKLLAGKTPPVIRVRTAGDKPACVSVPGKAYGALLMPFRIPQP